MSDPSDRGDALPQIDFSTFIVSLSTSALYHLGLVEDPQTGQKAAPDLPLASQTIDTLAVLQEKTRGNLDPDEEQLLQSLLTELRMRAVQVR
ncbi:MAG: DUF1844 domain-containing protein [Myxococcales bacterium]|nr:DUF1844 domain-containing protein [Myxococcales bacterium]